MKHGICFLLFVSISLTVYSQEEKIPVIDIDLNSYCEDEKAIHDQNQSLVCVTPEVGMVEKLDKQIKTIIFDPEKEKAKTCSALKEIALLNPAPVEVKLHDDQGGKWKIRVLVGHSRMLGSIQKQKMKLESSTLNITIKEFQFDERTSDSHFNPKNWKTFGQAFKWIDEPTNTLAVSLENKKNAFFLTLYHPKVLKTYFLTDAGPVAAPENIPNGDISGYLSGLPDGTKGVQVQNTRRNLVWMIGYGRNFTLLDSKKGGKVTYTPRVDAGIHTGVSRGIYFDKGSFVEDKLDKSGVQGYGASLGHRLEYKRGTVSLFVDQRLQYSRLKHGFLDGTATYSTLYAPTTFGIAVDIITLNKKKTRK